jgi:Flp pilus assembly protein TadG
MKVAIQLIVLPMSKLKGLPNLYRRLRDERDGNFAIMTALLLPALLAVVGVAIDVSQLLNNKSNLQSALDAASLATAAALANGDITTANASSYATNIAASQLISNLSSEQQAALKGSIKAAVTNSGSGTAQTYVVTVTGSYNENLIAFGAFYNGGVIPVSGSSQSQSQTQSTNALSLYLVLDRSGSMSFVTDTIKSHSYCQNYNKYNWYQYPNLWPSYPCYVNKMGSLKTAASGLFDKLDEIESADKTNKIVRVGAVSFNEDTQTPSNLKWGTKKARAYVTALPDYPDGGTDMTGGMDTAYNALIAPSEANAQSAKGNSNFFKFLVLMTDGENTGASSNWNKDLDTETLATCQKARDAGITIYTVAYMAPSNGKTLLQSCADDTSNYFEATDMDSLVKAFNTIGTKVTKQTTRMTN